jgi:SAM-dependent methyltransferase
VFFGGSGLATLDEYLAPYSTDDYVEAFKRYRHLPRPLLKRYARDLLAEVPADRRRRTIRFLDVGAGTGQFASALHAEAAEQGLELHTTLLEPSPAFSRSLKQSPLDDHAELVDERLEDFEPSDRFDLVLASEVAHLFESPEVAFDALRDVTTDGGIVALRYGSKSQVRDRSWYEFFSAAADVDHARAPASGEYENLLAARGFEWSATEVDESRHLSIEERLGIVAEKAYSSYCLVDAEAFERGLRRLADALERHTVSTLWRSGMTWTTARARRPR